MSSTGWSGTTRPSGWSAATAGTVLAPVTANLALTAYLLSAQAGFVNGVVLPVDGGRAALGADPEAT